MPSRLSPHLRECADHGELGMHPACPICRDERLAGPLPSTSAVPRRAGAYLAARAPRRRTRERHGPTAPPRFGRLPDLDLAADLCRLFHHANRSARKVHVAPSEPEASPSRSPPNAQSSTSARYRSSMFGDPADVLGFEDPRVAVLGTRELDARPGSIASGHRRRPARTPARGPDAPPRASRVRRRARRGRRPTPHHRRPEVAELHAPEVGTT